MEELHEFANILTQKEEEYNATVEQAANAFTYYFISKNANCT